MNAPLKGTRVVEFASQACTLPLRLALSFAARMAAGLGAEVLKIGSKGDDPVGSIGPFVAGVGALSRFLDQGKLPVPGNVDADPVSATLAITPRPDIVLCDDQGFEQLGTHASDNVYAVFSTFPPGTANADLLASEFTVMASSGLLDLVGDP